MLPPPEGAPEFPIRGHTGQHAASLASLTTPLESSPAEGPVGTTPQGGPFFGETYCEVLRDEEWTVPSLWLVLGAVVLAFLRRQVLERLQLTMSGAVGHNKFVAKVASSHFKPDQQVIVPSFAVASFLSGFPLRKLPGMGGKRGLCVSSRLPQYTFAGCIQRLPFGVLQQKLGTEEAEFLYNLVRGCPEGSDSVQSNIRVKSMLAFKSLPPPGVPPGGPQLPQWLHTLSRELCERADLDFRLYARIPKTITLHFCSGNPANQRFTRSCQIPYASAGGPCKGPPDVQQIWQLGMQQLTRLQQEQQQRGVPLQPCLRVALALGDFVERKAGVQGTERGIVEFFDKQPKREGLRGQSEGTAEGLEGTLTFATAGDATDIAIAASQETPEGQGPSRPPLTSPIRSAKSARKFGGSSRAGKETVKLLEDQDAPAECPILGNTALEAALEGPLSQEERCISVSSQLSEGARSEEEVEVLEVIDVSEDFGECTPQQRAHPMNGKDRHPTSLRQAASPPTRLFSFDSGSCRDSPRGPGECASAGAQRTVAY
ncbi:hypothetical protein cyc_03165 [Cyclospora cayetanensis]|uniref:UmuC domain-containing protein n=1 Tax=Cyclospora cayetanensis TaxID=88456 RepID=A0A1D3DAI7_9EIME|nr:hypothetical protein cyc_03165 [Cyclospora cayetanensis]